MTKLRREVARPVIGKRGKTVYTKADGSFEIKGLKPGYYNLMLSKAGFQTRIEQAEAVTSETVSVSVLELLR